MGLRFVETPLAGLLVVELDPMADERGLFARSYCASTFRERGLHADWPQCNVSFNARRATLRGMHFQRSPHQEVKLVRCTRGRAFDVAIDLRLESPTRLQWFGLELSQDNRSGLYVPAGFAHGFQTLEDECEILYMMGDSYYPELADGVRWDDSAFQIGWPLPAPILSAKDASYASVDS